MTITDITPIIPLRTEKIKLAAYCRVSSDSTDQLHSFAAQIRYYSEYTKQNPEYELVDIYADEGLTGTEMSKREELQRLLQDCQKGKVERIIVKSVSRFARNTEELLVMLRMLKDNGISIFFEEQSIDSTKLNSELLITFLGMIAQQESVNISGNLRWGIQKRMEKGTYICSHVPYGYRLINGKVVIYEPEAIIARKIFDLYLEGYGMLSITNILTKEKAPTMKGATTWSTSSVRGILKNEKYIGDALLQKRYSTYFPYKQKKNYGEQTQYYIENYNPQIIPKEVFQAVQALLQSRQKAQDRDKRYPLSKIIRCPDCGRTFRRIVTNNKAYWSCAKLISDNGTCQARRMREDMIYDSFINMVYKLKINRDSILAPLIENLELLQDKTSQNHSRIRQIDKELADLSAKNLVITKLYSNGILNSSDYTLQMSELNNKITALRCERRKKLHDDENDLMLDSLKRLNELIEIYPPAPSFDLELFEEIVEKIIINDNAKLTFCLIGELQLTEEIKEKGRCKHLEST